MVFSVRIVFLLRWNILTCLFLVAICKCRLINELLHLNEFNVPFAVLKDDRWLRKYLHCCVMFVSSLIFFFFLRELRLSSFRSWLTWTTLPVELTKPPNLRICQWVTLACSSWYRQECKIMGCQNLQKLHAIFALP